MRKIGLVGCVKSKKLVAAQAGDLYVSPLFAYRRRFVVERCSEWWILSAHHGLLHPDEVIAPYDVSLNRAGSALRRKWSAKVLLSIDEHIGLQNDDVVEVHAGVSYCEYGLLDGLWSRGVSVEVPTKGMGIGEQLAFYRESMNH